jgi:methylmalonyl-CoA/ethylmalonyl-CoA epimerase
MFDRIDHIGIAVEDLDGALALFEQTFGMPSSHRETVDEQGVEAALLDVGENHVELLRPLGPDTPSASSSPSAGPGIHHVAYQVTDIEAALAACKGAGLRLIDETPAHRHPAVAVAFLYRPLPAAC